MKRFCIVLAGIFSVFFLNAQSFVAGKVISPFNIAISCNKTTNIIFPYDIISVDRGSGSVLVQRAKGVENILQIKGDTANFPETNLSIVTADAKFYSFLLQYADEPSVLNLQLYADTEKPAGKLEGFPVGRARFEDLQQAIMEKPGFLHKSARSQKMKLSLQSIYLQDSLLLFGVKILNKSALDYPVESIHFYVRDRKRVKRTAIQQVELSPFYKNTLPVICGMQSVDLVIAFPPFTFPDTQELVIEVKEAGGGRNLTLPISSRTLLKVKAL